MQIMAEHQTSAPFSPDEESLRPGGASTAETPEAETIEAETIEAPDDGVPLLDGDAVALEEPLTPPALPATPPASAPHRANWIAGILLAIALMVWINLGFRALSLLNPGRPASVAPATAPSRAFAPRQPQGATLATQRTATSASGHPARAGKSSAWRPTRRRMATAKRRRASKRRRARVAHAVVLGQGIVLEDDKSIIHIRD